MWERSRGGQSNRRPKRWNAGLHEAGVSRQGRSPLRRKLLLGISICSGCLEATEAKAMVTMPIKSVALDADCPCCAGSTVSACAAKCDEARRRSSRMTRRPTNCGRGFPICPRRAGRGQGIGFEPVSTPHSLNGKLAPAVSADPTLALGHRNHGKIARRLCLQRDDNWKKGIVGYRKHQGTPASLARAGGTKHKGPRGPLREQ